LFAVPVLTCLQTSGSCVGLSGLKTSTSYLPLSCLFILPCLVYSLLSLDCQSTGGGLGNNKQLHISSRKGFLASQWAAGGGGGGGVFNLINTHLIHDDSNVTSAAKTPSDTAVMRQRMLLLLQVGGCASVYVNIYEHNVYVYECIHMYIHMYMYTGI